MKHAFLVFTVYVLLAGLSGFAITANAAPGDLDTSFSFDGRLVDTLLGISSDQGQATALQADGKILVAGPMTFSNNQTACGITRHHPNGALDQSFDGDGRVFVQFSSLLTCRAIAVQADGKILVAGSTSLTGAFADFALARFNPNGSSDTSFNTSGSVLTNIAGYDSANAIAIQPDGKIVVAGVSNTGGANFALVRYNPNGSLDTSFDTDGKVSTDFGGTDEQVNALAIQADGKIVAAGFIQNGSPSFDNDFALIRYNANGSLDTTFDGDGKITTDMQGAGVGDRAYGLAIQADGKIVAAGSAFFTENNGTSSRFGLARYNADGSLDTSFDADGKVITLTSTAGFGSNANAVAIQTDGRIVATGYSHNNGTWADFVITRYNTDGTPDNSFDGDGQVSTDFLLTHESALAAAIQTDGKIVAAGYTGFGGSQDYDFALVRYNPDGSLDTTFDTDGKVVTNLGYPTSSGASDVAAQTNGKIVVAGHNYNGFNDDFALIRYNADGTRDESFGTGGKVLTDISGFAQGERAKAVAIQADGKIVAAGQTTLSGPNSDFALARYNTDGSLDTTFDVNGLVTTTFSGNSYDFANAVAIQPDGKIVAVGVAVTSVNFDFAIARYNPDGSLDTTFDGDGKATTAFSPLHDYAYALVIQPDGKIVVAGSHGNSPSGFALARYNPNGSLDTSFDGDGMLTTSFSDSFSGASAVALQTDGKIVAGGGAQSGGQGDYALARYNSDGSLDQSFDGDGKVTTNISGSDSGNAMVIQTDGKIVVSGYSSGGAAGNNASLARYNADGSLDAAFGTGGTKTFDMGSAANDFINGMTLDANGKIVVAGETSGSITVARILSDFAPAAVPFDFDGDGKSDISIFRPSNGDWWYLRSSDGGNRAFGFGNSSDKLVPADFTGDGKTDITIWRPSTGEWFVLRSEEVSYFSFPFGTSGDIPVTVDFDADGRADAAIFRPSNSTWYIRRSSDGVVIIQQFGQAGDVPVVADYDGDRRSDIAIWRASSGEWWINRSTAGIVAYTFGNGSDKPVQGDYTGDGKADAAFFRPSSSEWFVLRSENNSYYSFGFGTNRDIPTPADYDGDGKTDATVFRPTTNTWYSNRTTAGVLIQGFGQTGDKPVPNAFVPQ